MAARGDVIGFRRPCNVDVDDVGDPACDAKDSTSSIECDCHPLFTFTMAYERRVRSSDDSWSLSVSGLGKDFRCSTSPILLAAEDALLTALVFLECPRACGRSGEIEDPGFTSPSAVLFCPAVEAIEAVGRDELPNGSWAAAICDNCDN